MANSTGTHSYSTSLQCDPAGGSAYAEIGEVRKIGLPSAKVSSSDRTNLNSPSAAKEFVPGMIDAGGVTATLTWTRTAYAWAWTNLRKPLMAFQLAFPLVGTETQASKLTFAGHVEEVGGEVPEDDVITFDLTFKISGLPVFVEGTP